MAERNSSDIARELAMRAAAGASHMKAAAVTTAPWQQDTGQFAFDVEVEGRTARVVVSVSDV